MIERQRSAGSGAAPRAEGRHRVAAVVLFGALVVPLGVPFLGVLVSLMTLGLAPALGPRVWPGTGRGTAASYGLLALAAFWAAPVLSLQGAGLVSGWLVLPLCGPADAFAWLAPTVVALAAYAAACVASVRLTRPILWVGAAALAMATYEAVWAVLGATGDRWVC